jgi:hypothetical protein
MPKQNPWPDLNTEHTWLLYIKKYCETLLTLWRQSFFKIFAHPVFKMWIIQEPNEVELWNKRNFEEKRQEIMQHL